MSLDRSRPILIAGASGLVGSALCRAFRADGYDDLLTPSSSELDLRSQRSVHAWLEDHRPEGVVVAAGTVGGILANSTRPGEFLYDNLAIALNLIEASRLNGVAKLLYLGSSCIYPRDSPQPIREDYLLSGVLEPTNEGYALAKIAGVKLCDFYRSQYGCNFISAMPTNLYGPGDNFDLTSSHVLPALIRRFDDAKQANELTVQVWGSGRPMREFLHVDDLAAACVHLFEEYDEAGHVNIGSGREVTIRELALIVRDIVHPDAEVVFDLSKPDGMPRKRLDTSILDGLGWHASIQLEDGIASTYAWYQANRASLIDLRAERPAPARPGLSRSGISRFSRANS